MLPRVLVAAAAQAGTTGGALLELDARQSHHLVRVLRLAAGAPVECFDGAGARYAARIERADPRGCTVRLAERVEADTESPVRVTLAQCISAAERMDWTIEKAVELGVGTIQPLVSERTQVRLDAARMQRRHEHWARIVEAACMQCGRDRLPMLRPVVDLRHWLAAGERAAPGAHLVLAPHSSARLSRLRVEAANPIELLVGPESGLSEGELAHAQAAGFEAVRIGPRVLRTETAGLAALAALQALAGDF